MLFITVSSKIVKDKPAAGRKKFNGQGIKEYQCSRYWCLVDIVTPLSNSTSSFLNRSIESANHFSNFEKWKILLFFNFQNLKNEFMKKVLKIFKFQNMKMKKWTNERCLQNMKSSPCIKSAKHFSKFENWKWKNSFKFQILKFEIWKTVSNILNFYNFEIWS